MQMYVDAETDLKLPVEILIGTVPLRQSVQSVTFVTQTQTVITSQPPSAPPPNQPDAGDTFDLRMSFLIYRLINQLVLCE